MTYNFSSPVGCNVTLPGPSLQSLCSAAEYITFMTALDAAIRSHPIISGNCERIRPIEEPDDEYDFIVVGGGAGGAAVTGRLAEITDWKILLLEAGEDESAAAQIPAFTLPLLGSEIDWNYYTSNESHACLSNNGSCFWSAAKCLGGNTAHNFMMYLRGNPTDYNNWAAQGNDGWEWEKILETYKKQEDNADIDDVGRQYHGTGGKLSVGHPPTISKFTEPFMKAAEQSDFGTSNDLNGQVLKGLTNYQCTQKRGVRFSSASAYLRPLRNNKNLHISLKSHATKIVIENNTAVGVEYVKNGKLRSVRAKREVIISSGFARSPQLLLLSGIGPKEHLESKGIKVVLDLPGVGENLHDHTTFLFSITMNQTDTFENDIQAAEEYLLTQTGPMSVVSNLLFAGPAETDKTTPGFPDVAVYFQGFTASCAPGDVGALRSNKKREISVFSTCLHPKSRGRVSLASDDPFEQPVLWSNALSELHDREVILDGIEMALNITKAEALREYDINIATEPLEACSDYTFATRQYWDCAMQQETSSIWHQVGTCKMGPASDSMAVVDSKLRVHGIRNLRVADASIIPQVTSSNTGSPTMMIGERAAEFIKEAWLSSYK